MTDEERKDDDEFDEVGEEECTCGHFFDTRKSELRAFDSAASSSSSSSDQLSSKGTISMDTSFVHLPIHLYQHVLDEATRTPPVPAFFAAHSSTIPKSLEMYMHLQEMIRASQTGGDGANLCADCINRVEQALDADSDRLRKECIMYNEAVRKEEERLERLERALKSVPMSQTMTDPFMTDETSTITTHPNTGVHTAEQAFQHEIEALEKECRQQEAELAHLKSLQHEQIEVSRDLDEAEYLLHVEQNALELEARAFDNDQARLYQTLRDIENEVDQLSSNISLPSLLLDLQVDKERGLRYPLINELRLAYRPKGDIKWNEIQAAWSLSAQLLLIVGTLFHYPSEEWKIVPLSYCAKLIYFSKTPESDRGDACASGQSIEANSSERRQERAVVYHLGHPKTNGAKAIRAWNQLLHQVAMHVSSKLEEEYKKGAMQMPFPKMPYSISNTTVGPINLNQLSENDDAGWSRAIHYMASNLLWLSECSALYTSQQVLWTSAVLQTCKT